MSNNDLLIIKALFKSGLGSRAIAKNLGITRWKVQQAYKELGIYNIGRKKPFKAICKEKKCIGPCEEVKSISQFRKRIRVINNQNRTYYESLCLACEKESHKERCKKNYVQNKNIISKLYHSNLETKLQKSEYNRKYYTQNKEIIHKYKKSRRKQDRENLRVYNKKRRYSDPVFKLRGCISNAVNRMLFKNNSCKNDKSCINFLPFTIKELKDHLESQFEYWMTWENHGSYHIKVWDDNDSSTWTWQIDHIISQSKLPYDSMQDENFKKCWALENLRPLNAKQNLLKGNK